MSFPSPLVCVDSKHYFQYVEDCVPENRAVIQMTRANKPTGVVLVYRLLNTDSSGALLRSTVMDSMTAVDSASEAILNHARACILPHLFNAGTAASVSFIGKAFNSVEHRWRASAPQNPED